MESRAKATVDIGYVPPDCYSPVIDDSIQQADLLFDFPAIRINKDFDPAVGAMSAAKSERSDLIVLTQSCDLVAGKVDDILLCNHYDFQAVQDQDPNFSDWKVKEEIRRGNRPSYYLLHACTLDGLEMGVRLVNFRQLRALPIEYVLNQSELLDRHLRIESPYREHLSQAFGRFIMRIGLPQDIPQYEKPKKELR